MDRGMNVPTIAWSKQTKSCQASQNQPFYISPAESYYLYLPTSFMLALGPAYTFNPIPTGNDTKLHIYIETKYNSKYELPNQPSQILFHKNSLLHDFIIRTLAKVKF